MASHRPGQGGIFAICRPKSRREAAAYCRALGGAGAPSPYFGAGGFTSATLAFERMPASRAVGAGIFGVAATEP
jgi:hypothetical protein